MSINAKNLKDSKITVPSRPFFLILIFHAKRGGTNQFCRLCSLCYCYNINEKKIKANNKFGSMMIQKFELWILCIERSIPQKWKIHQVLALKQPHCKDGRDNPFHWDHRLMQVLVHVYQPQLVAQGYCHSVCTVDYLQYPQLFLPHPSMVWTMILALIQLHPEWFLIKWTIRMTTNN